MRIGLASFRRFGAGRLGEGGLYASLLLSVIAVAGIAAWFMLPEPSDAGDQDVWRVSSAVIRTVQDASTGVQPGQITNQAGKDTPAAPAAEPATVGVATAAQPAEAAKASRAGY
ncbi:hypothetical protein [Bradyrhizobium sp. JR3.5]